MSENQNQQPLPERKYVTIVRDGYAAGLVQPGEVFTLRAFCKRIQVSRPTMDQMRKSGLIVRSFGERKLFVVSDDFYDFAKKLPANGSKMRKGGNGRK